jgi:hypothetical protein
VLLHREGPPEWGAVEFRVVKKVFFQPSGDNQAEREQRQVFKVLHPDD